MFRILQSTPRQLEFYSFSFSKNVVIHFLSFNIKRIRFTKIGHLLASIHLLKWNSITRFYMNNYKMTTLAEESDDLVTCAVCLTDFK